MSFLSDIFTKTKTALETNAGIAAFPGVVTPADHVHSFEYEEYKAGFNPFVIVGLPSSNGRRNFDQGCMTWVSKIPIIIGMDAVVGGDPTFDFADLVGGVLEGIEAQLMASTFNLNVSSIEEFAPADRDRLSAIDDDNPDSAKWKIGYWIMIG